MIAASRRVAVRSSPLVLVRFANVRVSEWERSNQKKYLLQQQQRSLSHIEKNEKLGRPVSPHVTIYAFPLAAWSSVGHRVTGALLTIGMYGIGIGALGGVDVAHVMYAVGHSGIGPLAKFAVALPLTYHGLGGVRHLYWEHYPDNLSPETQRQASVALIASSTLVSAAIALM